MLFPSRQQQIRTPYPGQRQARVRLPQNRIKPSNSIVKSGWGGLTKTLDSVQQILNMVQSTAPFIQEYGPMLKNLPAMYRMMKAFKEFENEVEGEAINESKEQKTQAQQKQETEIQIKEKVLPEHPTKPKKDGKSKPKLYI